MIYGKKINNPEERIKILIAPLDWGLGHVTRCIPIIKAFEIQNCDLILAADKDAFLLLKKEFPSMVILRLFGYKIRYARSKKWLVFKLIQQAPRLKLIISKETRWLKNIVHTHRPDVVISDNRPGMYNPGVISIYLTHQLAIKTGNWLLNKIVNTIHNSFIKKYDQCWIPDFSANGLAGELSHPRKLQSNAIYLGALSRFENLTVGGKIYDLLISISGPEPQRTIFENLIFQQLKNFQKTVLVVRGLPAESKKMQSFNSYVEIINHLPSTELNRAFLQSDMIICRSGYTTIMDLIKIDKPAILVPTPGQTEQEYLAAHHMKMKNFFSVKQKDFLLEEVLSKAAHFPFIKYSYNMDNYKKLISEFVLSIKSGTFAQQ